MIDIYRADYDSELNVFHGRDRIGRDEVVVVEDAYGVKGNTVAKPNEAGHFAFGGTFLYTSNGVYPEFSGRPIPLHDRNMDLETPGHNI